MPFKICKICSEEFFTFNNKKEHCGKSFCEKEYKDKFYIKKENTREGRYEKICPVCNKTYKAFSKNQKFCSKECFNNSVENVCYVCNKTFYSNNENKKCCSKECRDKLFIKICLTCGKTFRTNGKNSKYCSEECCKTRYEKVCPICEDIFRTNNKNKIYCSSLCRSVGTKLGKYKINQTEIDINAKIEDIQLIFNNRPINTWYTSGFNESLKQSVLERDGHKCYICGKEIGRLHVHHIIPRNNGGKHIPQNLITLCGGCHRSVESGNVEKAIKNCVKRALKVYEEKMCGDYL